MKKLFKNKKAKFIALGSLLTLSLASVGFATWTLGVIEKDADVKAGLTVEGVDSKTLIVSASTTTNSLTLDSSTKGSNGLVSKTAFNLTLDVIASNNLIENDLTINVNLKVNQGNDATTDKNKVSVTANDVFGRKEGEAIYLTLDWSDLANNTLTLAKSEFKDYQIDGGATNFKEAKKTYNTLNIKYGSYFNNQAPDDFYNAKLNELLATYKNDKTEANRNSYLNALNQAENELNAWKAAWANPTNLVISFSANVN